MMHSVITDQEFVPVEEFERGTGWEFKAEDQDDKPDAGYGTKSDPTQTRADEDTSQNDEEFQPDLILLESPADFQSPLPDESGDVEAERSGEERIGTE